MESREEALGLNPEIMDVIKEFESYDQCKRPYAVYFTDTKQDFPILKQDTLIYITFLKTVPLLKNVNYKGTLLVDSLTVAIFDREEIGTKYYDTNKLSKIDYKHLCETTEAEWQYFAVLEVVNDSLIRWEGP